MSEAPRFLIEEIGGGRSISLASRALPYQRVNFGAVEQARKKTRYPGNGTHTIQVLGPDWLDTAFQTTWKDRFLTGCVEATGFDYLQTGQTILARDLVRAFTELCAAGAPLRVEWGPVVRRGILSLVRPTWVRVEDVEVEIEFDWIGTGDAAPPVASAASESPESQVQRATSQVDQAADARPATVYGDETVRQRAAQRSNREQVSQVFDAIRRVRSGVQTGDAIATRAAAAIATAALAINGTASADFEETSDRPYTSETVFDDVTAVLGVESWRRTYTRSEQNLAVVTLAVAGEQAREVSPGALAIVTLRQGQTLRHLALKHYGSSDDWTQIATFNGFSSSTQPVGTVVVVPPSRART